MSRILIDYITKEVFSLSWPSKFYGRGYVNYMLNANRELYRVRLYDGDKFEKRYCELRRRPKIFIFKNNGITKFVRVLTRTKNRWGEIAIRYEIMDNLRMAEYIDDNRKWIDAETSRYKLGG